MRRWREWLTAALVLTALAGTTARADDDKEEKIPLDKVPRAVLDAVKTKFKGAKIIGAELEKEHGKLIYEIKLARANQKIEVKVALEVKIIEIEKTIFAKPLAEKGKKGKHEDDNKNANKGKKSKREDDEDDDDEKESKKSKKKDVKKGKKNKRQHDEDDDKEHKKSKKKEAKKKRDKDDD